MRWIAISGSWRRSSPDLEQDVRDSVADIMRRGDGIVTGGALGVDYVAAQEAIAHNPVADRLKIIIPTPLDVFAAHYRKRANEGVITVEQAEALIGLLTTVRQRSEQSLVEMSHTVLNEETYYDRNTEVLKAAHELLAFQVNDSAGVQDTVNKARELDMGITLKQYVIDD